jgi:hypothetical protein
MGTILLIDLFTHIEMGRAESETRDDQTVLAELRFNHFLSNQA